MKLILLAILLAIIPFLVFGKNRIHSGIPPPSHILHQPSKLYEHPLDPLTPSEITLTVKTINRYYQPDFPWQFIWITLKEPPKSELLPYFLSDSDPPSSAIDRKSFSLIRNRKTGEKFEVVVHILNVQTSLANVDSFVRLPLDVDLTFAQDEMDNIEEFVVRIPTIQKRLVEYGISNFSQVIPDVWKFGYAEDRPDLQGRTVAQVYFYLRRFTYDNYYAHPLGFVALVDILSQELLGIEELSNNTSDTELTKENHSDFIALKNCNYDPDASPELPYRNDISPILIEQENGASFTILGNLVQWQKFKIRIGFNGREGLVLHNINYNDKGRVRPILYRAALSEVFVPYGDPKVPYHRKMAFDAGEYGLGFSSLELGEEVCKGTVHYFTTVTNKIEGTPQETKNAICIYEEDAGILWRKADTTTNRIVTARSQRLVISFIAVLSNYDYQFKWYFYQDASIRFESTLTGIVDPNLLPPGATTDGHGTVVSPNINAQYHQHFLAVRLDTEIDGNQNTVSVVDVHPDSGASGSAENPYGNGISATETTLKTAWEARTKSSTPTARTWHIIGDPENKNNMSGTPCGWKLISENTPPLMMKPDSVLHRKGAFVDFAVWVTPYQEDQLYAGGSYLKNGGISEWVDLNPYANVENTDIVLWHVLGVTHLPIVEDWPVMNSVLVGFWLKPANFFDENPAIDVKPFVRLPK